jgi:hypothetical protein
MLLRYRTNGVRAMSARRVQACVKDKVGMVEREAHGPARSVHKYEWHATLRARDGQPLLYQDLEGFGSAATRRVTCYVSKHQRVESSSKPCSGPSLPLLHILPHLCLAKHYI